jgi:hypothetical protein
MYLHGTVVLCCDYGGEGRAEVKIIFWDYRGMEVIR